MRYKLAVVTGLILLGIMPQSRAGLLPANGLTLDDFSTIQAAGNGLPNGVAIPGLSVFSSNSLFDLSGSEACPGGECGRIRQLTAFSFVGGFSDFGWQADLDLLEPVSSHAIDWVCDQSWCTQAQNDIFLLDEGIAIVSSVEFRAAGATGVTGEGGLAPVNAVETPIPAALWLFGSGMVALSLVARRRGTSV
ncbi:MAG: hypothetical protein RQ736_00770 [Thiogranum sp.]|nr:hypothetical protein [Thiogranum sp.]